MGIETAALTMMAISAAAEVGKAGTQVVSAKQREEALDMQARELRITNQQKTLANYDQIQKVLDAQIAHQSVSGTSFSSPSFNAIQRNTENIGARKQANIDLGAELDEENVRMEKSNVRTTLFGQLFGDVAETAKSTYQFSRNAPSKG